MQRTRLGSGGAEVSALGLGCAGMARADEAAAHATMAAALALGVDFFDTSDLYGVGRGEELIGGFLAKVGRGRVTVATKFGSMPGAADGVGTGPRQVKSWHPG